MKKIFLILFLVSGFILGQNASTFTNVAITGTAVITGTTTVGALTAGNITATSITLSEDSYVGSDVFTTTATADTVVISGALATDIYFVNGIGGSVDQQDVLQVEAKADTLIVHRLAAGASALEYNWLRIKAN